MNTASQNDNKNLILYNPETGKTRKLRLGFGLWFFLFGPLPFFFRGLIKEGAVLTALLIISCYLFDNEIGVYPLFDFSNVGMAVGIGLGFMGNYYCLDKLLQKGYNLDQTSPLAAANTLMRCKKYLKGALYEEIRHKLERIAAQDGA